jgi:hypothetical protein
VAPRCAVANHHFVGAVHASLTGDVGHHVAECSVWVPMLGKQYHLEIAKHWWELADRAEKGN